MEVKMLYSLDARKKPELWVMLKHQMLNYDMCFIVQRGKCYWPLKNIERNEENIEEWIADMKALPIARISVSRGGVVAPHFFGKKEKDRIVVTDFLVHFDNGKGLDLQAVQRELGTAIIDMMCGAPFPSEIFIPIELPSWEIDQIDIFHGESGMVFRNIEPHVVM